MTNVVCEPSKSVAALAEKIRRDLQDLAPATHEPLPSYREFGRRYQVGMNTVQSAMAELEKEGILLRMPRRGTFYRPKPVEPAAAGARKVRCVSLIMEKPLRERVFQVAREEYLAGYSEAIEQRHAVMRIVLLQGNTRFEDALSKNFAVEEQGCVLVWMYHEKLMAWLTERRVPFVVHGSRPVPVPGALPCHRVLVNKANGCFEATRRLIAEGHKQIGYVGVPHNDLGTIYSGFFAAMTTAGLSLNPEFLMECSTDDLEEARRPMAEYLRRPRLPTAIMAQNDAMALALLEEARVLGIRVPEDLSMVGFNGLPETETSDPPLTTVRQPRRSHAQAAIQLLTEAAEGLHTDFQTRL
nr:substrate-binding domain-containing protein [Candidatus Brocadiia bacterium]